MAEEITLHCIAQHDALAPAIADRSEELTRDGLPVRIVVQPSAQLMQQLGEGGTAAGSLPGHLCLILDVSGSMDTEVSPGLTRKRMAVEAAKACLEYLQPEDRLTVIAFDTVAHPVFESRTVEDRDAIARELETIMELGGGGTVLHEALDVARRVFKHSDLPTGKCLVLTDGEDMKPMEALYSVHWLADQGVVVDALGVGEYDHEFFFQLVNPSSGACEKLEPERAEEFFRKSIAVQQDILAVVREFAIWLSPEMQVRHIYRAQPEVLLYDDLPPKDNTVKVPLKYLEKSRPLSFVICTRIPEGKVGARFRILKATLTYDLPALERKNLTATGQALVRFSLDPDETARNHPEVRTAHLYAQAQLEVKQIRKLLAGPVGAGSVPGAGTGSSAGSGAMEGTAAANDLAGRRREAIRRLRGLRDRFQAAGDPELMKFYQDQARKLEEDGRLSLNDLNTMSSISTRAASVPKKQIAEPTGFED
ncbi:MAG: VWA domain-containing protein [Planctomycetota bacterium]